MSDEIKSTDFPYGAEWVRVDFHLHTHADREFTYTDDLDWYHHHYVAALVKADIRLAVITTHNANFPVLEDAEQIHACAFDRKGIRVQSGSIDSPPIQENVVKIMEGGRDAFEHRKRIYEQWM